MASEMIELSPKQCEFINKANKRWNGKIGATRCGKTHVDILYVIPERILERKNKKGLNVILGVSKSTIERNLLEPMRNMYGERLISEINSENIAHILGEKVYCLGAEKVNQVSKIRGAEFKYVYCDELVEFNQEVFELLKSRLSLEYSVCDFTGNPESPTHWLKKFIDETNPDNIYVQNWTIYDNPFLPKAFVKALEDEYKGSVYFNRYILGQWCRAEGLCYPLFADKNDEYIIDDLGNRNILKISCGVDFGGDTSATAFVATAITGNYDELIVLESKRIKERIDSTRLNELFGYFVLNVFTKYKRSSNTYCDSAESVLIHTLDNYAIRNQMQTKINLAAKNEINKRIRALNHLIATKRFYVLRWNTEVITALNSACWDDAKKDKGDIRLDITGFDNPVDILDALEYSFENDINKLIRKERVWKY